VAAVPETNPARNTVGVAARGTVQLLIGRGLFMVSGYLITVILARGLGPAAYGVYGVVMSLLLWIEVVGDLGIQRATIKMVPEVTDSSQVAQTSAALLLVVSLLLFALCWAAAPWLASVFTLADGARLFRIAILDLPFNGLYLAYQGVLQGYRKFGTLAVTLVLYSLVKLLGIAALLLIGLSVEAALIVNVLATVGALCFLFTQNRPRIGLPDKALVKSMLKVAAPLGVFVVTMQFLLSAHLWLLKRFSTDDAVIGFYAAAFNLARLPTVVPFVLTGVVLASISLALARNDVQLARHYLQAASRFILVVLFPVCVLGAIDANPIMGFVYSDSYLEGGPFLAWLLVAFGLFALLDTLLHALIAAGQYYRVTATLLALVPVTLAINLLLIPTYGALGAAIGFVMTLAAGTAGAVFWIYHRYGAPAQLVTLLRSGAATAGVALISLQIDAISWWLLVKLPLLLLVYAALLALLRELSAEDLKPLAVWKKA